jgi:hypothetical protein
MVNEFGIRKLPNIASYISIASSPFDRKDVESRCVCGVGNKDTGKDETAHLNIW